MSIAGLAIRRAPASMYDAYIPHFDGTVCLGDELLPGAFELVATHREFVLQRIDQLLDDREES